MKICALIPIYMSDNSREVNFTNLKKMKETEFKYIDKVVICDQCFKDSDYIEGFEYLGPYSKLSYGLAEARNILFKWFYNSDYDYALLLDARENLSKSSLNSFATICKAIHNNQINIDCIQSTFGITPSSTRETDKCRDDYKSKMSITYERAPLKAGLHHVFMSNFKKKYGMELYIDCDKVTTSGHLTDSLVFEDIYFQELLQTYFHIYAVGDMVVNLGNQKASIWAPNGGESMKNINYKPQLKKMIDGIYNPAYNHKKQIPENIYINRDNDYIDLMTEYKSRKKSNVETISLL